MRAVRSAVLLLVALFALAALAAPASAQRRGGGHRSSYSRSYRTSTRSYYGPRTYRAPRTYHAPRTHRPPAYHTPRPHKPRRPRVSSPGTAHRPRTSSGRTPRSSVAAGGRNSRGRIKRSESARRDFMRRTGYPHGRPGYLIDHRVPLACGGADASSNMQWQTKAEAKAKDRTERIGCGRH